MLILLNTVKFYHVIMAALFYSHMEGQRTSFPNIYIDGISSIFPFFFFALM